MSQAFQVGAFSDHRLSCSTPLSLENGALWTGGKTNFQEYHRVLFEEVYSKFQTSKFNNLGHHSAASTMLNTIEPVWLEPQLASHFVDCNTGLTKNQVVLDRAIFTETQTQALQKISDTIFPNKANPSAQFPASFTSQIHCYTHQYTWMRALAWRITGQFNQITKLGKFHINNQIQSFDITILSHLPSGFLDAVAGRIDYCAQTHIKQVQQEIKLFQDYHCNK
ncbi:hypothetical protein DSO57_1032521 [Entomophthora muscae]|uniref:Uncharacterized protein n=1 Tax=Entomophthora muscae TaxID=34485 RepID=A0ACC2SPY0_9FUNG|nr:hypothetical protein DSO57_1032521 [Entomophthora muscae]